MRALAAVAFVALVACGTPQAPVDRPPEPEPAPVTMPSDPAPEPDERSDRGTFDFEPAHQAEVPEAAEASPREETTFAMQWQAAVTAFHGAASRDARMRALAALAAATRRDDAPEVRELRRLELEIMRAVDAWAAEHGERTQPTGTACMSDVECETGHCSGTGCLPGSWHCVQPVPRDQPHTSDMRRACLCNGMSFEGSSTALRGSRLRDARASCAEQPFHRR